MLQTGQSNIITDNWHHVAFSFDSSNSNLKLFVDGILKNSSNVSILTSSIQLSNMILGSNIDASIDNVKIFNTALDTEQIKYLASSANYNNSLQNNIVDLRFDEFNNVPTQFIDQISNKNYNAIGSLSYVNGFVKGSKAIDLNNGYISLDDININNEMSFSAWINVNTLESPLIQRVLSKAGVVDFFIDQNELRLMLGVNQITLTPVVNPVVVPQNNIFLINQPINYATQIYSYPQVQFYDKQITFSCFMKNTVSNTKQNIISIGDKIHIQMNNNKLQCEVINQTSRFYLSKHANLSAFTIINSTYNGNIFTDTIIGNNTIAFDIALSDSDKLCRLRKITFTVPMRNYAPTSVRILGVDTSIETQLLLEPIVFKNSTYVYKFSVQSNIDNQLLKVQFSGTGRIKISNFDIDAQVEVNYHPRLSSQSLQDLVVNNFTYVTGIVLSQYFIDPNNTDEISDNDIQLVYNIQSSDTDVATCAINQNVAVINPGTINGISVITIRATDHRGAYVEKSFNYRLDANLAPIVKLSINNVLTASANDYIIDLNPYFSDPNNDPLLDKLTDNLDVLTYSVVSANTQVATATVNGSNLTIVGHKNGASQLTVTAQDLRALTVSTSFIFTRDVYRAPVYYNTIPTQTINKSTTHDITLSQHFSDPDNDELTFTASSSNVNVASTSILNTNVLRLSGLLGGSVTITVRATDPGGLFIERDFTLNVNNRTPVYTTEMTNVTIDKSNSHTMTLTNHFSDPDGDNLTFTAVITLTSRPNATIASTVISQSQLTINGLLDGTVRITVRATDPQSAFIERFFNFTVVNRPPTYITIPNITINKSTSQTITLSEHFSDPDGDTITYSVISSDSLVADVVSSGLNNVTLRVDGKKGGSATITVTATDSEQATTVRTFNCTVQNRIPVYYNTLQPISTTFINTPSTINLLSHVSDPDGDQIVFTVKTNSDSTVVTPSINGSYLTLNGLKDGASTITITAKDTENASIEFSFTITITNRPPTASGIAMSVPTLITVGSTTLPNLNTYFTDSDGDTLSYTATSNTPSVATVSINSTTLVINGLSNGTSTITVQANDGRTAGTVSRSFTFTRDVNRAPYVIKTIPNTTNTTNAIISSFETLVNYFGDEDGDTLTFSINNPNTSVAQAYVTGNSLTIDQTSKLNGTVTFTLTATDSKGATASFSFNWTHNQTITASLSNNSNTITISGTTTRTGTINVYSNDVTRTSATLLASGPSNNSYNFSITFTDFRNPGNYSYYLSLIDSNSAVINYTNLGLTTVLQPPVVRFVWETPNGHVGFSANQELITTSGNAILNWESSSRGTFTTRGLSLTSDTGMVEFSSHPSVVNVDWWAKYNTTENTWFCSAAQKYTCINGAFTAYIDSSTDRGATWQNIWSGSSIFYQDTYAPQNSYWFAHGAGQLTMTPGTWYKFRNTNAW